MKTTKSVPLGSQNTKQNTPLYSEERNMTEIDDTRIQIVKALLDLSPKVRAFTRGYLATYHPKK